LNKLKHSVLTLSAAIILFGGMISSNIIILMASFGLFLILCPKKSYQELKKIEES